MTAILLDTADEIARWLRVSHGVTPRQIHQWARRGRITRYPGNRYNAAEIVDWLDHGRDTRMVAVQRGVSAAGQTRDTVPACRGVPAEQRNVTPPKDTPPVHDTRLRTLDGDTGHIKRCVWPDCGEQLDSTRIGALCLDHAMLVHEAVLASTKPPVTNAQARAVQRRQVERDQEQARARARGQQPGWIYYVRVGDQVKIGYSADVKRRMRAYPPDSHLLAVHPGTRELETELHQRFAGSRAAGREWFRETVDLVEHMAQVVAQFGEPTRHRHHFRTDAPAMRSA